MVARQAAGKQGECVHEETKNPTTDLSVDDGCGCYGSDLIIDLLVQHGIEYFALNPGATIRGMLDSLRHKQGSAKQGPIACLHEEIAVAIAHGYAKASGKIMAVLIHSNVGLQHASMAIFNAWCDRVPILVIGGVGPLNTEHRRPWIDWIHTSRDQGSIVRDFVKWCDQPTSLYAAVESLQRAMRHATHEPTAPVYVGIDVAIQESGEAQGIQIEQDKRTHLLSSPQADHASLAFLLNGLLTARLPLIIADHLGRNAAAVQHLVTLAETLAIGIIDVGGRYNFPTNHPMCVTETAQELLAESDFVLALDVQDLHGALGGKAGNAALWLDKSATLVNVTLGDYLVSSWAADYQQLVPVDRHIPADSALLLTQLGIEVKQHIGGRQHKRYLRRYERLQLLHHEQRDHWYQTAGQRYGDAVPHTSAVVLEIWRAIKKQPWILTNYGSLATWKWIRRLWEIGGDRIHLGGSGGAGLGYGIGASIGAALAYRGSDKVCIDLQADGDLLFTPSALWTAAHHRIPLLVIVMNNRGYNNTREHAAEIGAQRKRNTQGTDPASTIDAPSVDFPGLARSFNWLTFDTIAHIDRLYPAVKEAVRTMQREQRPVLLDVLIQ